MVFANSLCNHCSLIFSFGSFNNEEEDSTVVEDYLRSDTLPGLPALQEAADYGCLFCAELRSRIVGLDWPINVRDITIGPATLIDESYWEAELTPEQKGIAMIEVEVRSAKDDRKTLLFELFAPSGSYPSTHMRVRRRPPSTNRFSPECIEVLQQMISKCAGVHWQCDPGPDDFWPTRVVDVGPSDGAVDPKLMVTSGQASKYLALSHCWGKPGPGIRTLKTLSNTLQSHMRGITLNSMPQNFQHAIFVTRALGIKYIWIDSLCIIQDSKEDWATEGSQMDKIYRNAYVTLAATSASAGEDGFLDYALKDRMFTIPLLRGQNQESLFYEDNQIIARYMETRHNNRMEPDVDDSTWNSRGWTLQERHLSRRIIHFSKTQIFWECRRGFASECGQRITRLPFSIQRTYGPNDSSDDTSDESSSDGQTSSYELNDENSIDDDNISNDVADEQTLMAPGGLYQWWFQVLADYSSRHLTYASDKFPAISGLVKELNNYHVDFTGRDDQYVAGIWTGDLSDCLLWMPEHPTSMTDPGMYRAPSFSWARWDGTIIPSPRGWPDPHPKSSMIEYIGHEIVLETANEYGSIKSASLRLRTGITKVRRRDLRTGEGDASWNMGLHDTEEVIGFMTFDRLEDMPGENDQDTLYAMQVKVQDLSTPDRSGLVLRPVSVAHTFERIGVFQLDEQHINSLLMIDKDIITLV